MFDCQLPSVSAPIFLTPSDASTLRLFTASILSGRPSNPPTPHLSQHFSASSPSPSPAHPFRRRDSVSSSVANTPSTSSSSLGTSNSSSDAARSASSSISSVSSSSLDGSGMKRTGINIAHERVSDGSNALGLGLGLFTSSSTSTVNQSTQRLSWPMNVVANHELTLGMNASGDTEGRGHRMWS